MSFPEGTTIFELDRREVLNYKQDKLSKAQRYCQLHRNPVDLATDWAPPLLQAGFKKGVATLWLVEGLLMYLEEAQIMGVFQKIHSLASPKDHMLFDILTQTLLDAPYMVNQLNFLKHRSTVEIRHQRTRDDDEKPWLGCNCYSSWRVCANQMAISNSTSPHSKCATRLLRGVSENLTELSFFQP